MDRRYRIGEIVQLLDVSQHTLKHYEDKGLVIPKVDPETGYRYYTYREVGLLMEAIMYRAMGFGLSEVAELVAAPDADLACSFRKQLQRNKEEIAQLKRQNDLIAARIDAVDAVIGGLGAYAIALHDARHCLPHFAEDELEEDVSGDMKRTEWRRVYERSRLAMRVNVDGLDRNQTGCSESGNLRWGMVLEKPLPKRSPLKKHEEVFPKGRYLDLPAFVPIGQESDIESLAQDALNAAGVRPAGDALVVIHASCIHDGKLCFAVTISVPIE